ncbi:MAG: hypothetical protein QNK29_02170 [Desulfobacterales bacterium]|nr:hypothetical protein [Desulfobacterales bacterium]
MPIRPNLNLKADLIRKYGTITAAARDISNDEIELTEFRLSRIIHGRAKVLPEERRVIAWKLQKPIAELFAEE